MTREDGSIEPLRQAARVSPDNLPLRLHFASTLLQRGLFDEALCEFRESLQRWPENTDLKLGLASAFYQTGKNTHALVIVEELLKLSDIPARAYVLHARLLLRAGETEEAARQYRKAVEGDPALADRDLVTRLGLDAPEQPAADSDEEDGKLRASWEEVPEGLDVPVERPKVSFRDVGGMEGVKDEIRMKIIHPLNHPEIYAAYGKAIGGGILMYGPPGCGKTHLARATAGEIRAGFMSVGINDVLEMWIGNSEKNLHELFEQARRSKPCVVFFDEVDALASSRADMRHSAGRHLINQFLSELDGIEAKNDGLLILAATNAPWHLDPAFRRPGRFDRILFVPPPDAPARAAILRIQCEGKPVAEIDHEHLAKKTEHFSGADLKAVVDVAVEKKLKDAMKDGVPRPLTTKDLAAAAGSVKPSTREWFSTARNYALYSNQGGIYDDILKHLNLEK